MGQKGPKIAKQTYGFLCAILIAAAPLLFVGLANHVFWDDEAITANFARAVLTTGLPTDWDGRNLRGYRDGLLLNRRLVDQQSPWLQYYCAAAGFGLFGESTRAGRAPFALLGLATIALTFLVARRVLGSDRVALLSAGLVATSVPFLLFARQCRYFGLVMFFSLAAAACVLDPRAKRWSVRAAGAVAIALLFHSNYLSALAFVAGLGLACLVLADRRERLTAWLISGVLSCMGTLPWVLALKPYLGRRGHMFANAAPGRAAHLFGWYLRDISANGIVPVGAVVLLLVVLIWRGKSVAGRPLAFLTALALGSLLALSIISPQPIDLTREADVRYALGLLPFGCMGVAAAIQGLWCWRRAAAVIVLALHLGTNALWPTTLRSPMGEYVLEIMGDYQTCYEAAIEALAEAKHDDKVLVLPPHAIETLLFYLGDKLLFCNTLSEGNTNVLPFHRDVLPAHVYSSDTIPDWIVSFTRRDTPPKLREAMSTGRVTYRVKRLNVFGADTSRPEFSLHTFGPVTGFPASAGVFVFRRTDPSGITPQR